MDKVEYNVGVFKLGLFNGPLRLPHFALLYTEMIKP